MLPRLGFPAFSPPFLLPTPLYIVIGLDFIPSCSKSLSEISKFSLLYFRKFMSTLKGKHFTFFFLVHLVMASGSGKSIANKGKLAAEEGKYIKNIKKKPTVVWLSTILS